MLYALACVLVPALWGALVHVAFDRLRRRRAVSPRDGHPPADYVI